ncbi:TIGR01777 family oxidoreductase [soil metagenome]
MQTILITGGTGLIGKAITNQLLQKEYSVIVVTRKLPVNDVKTPGLSYAIWDVKQQTIDMDAVKKADHIIHLAGAGVVDKKWTDAYKKEILDSRTESSSLLVSSLINNANKVKTIISASAIGWYGADKAGKPFMETDPAANDFLGDTCKLWEQSIDPVADIGIRLVKLRTGIVLSNSGGALAEFKKPIKLGVAGILGDGKQIVSWIHVDDLCRMYIAAIENEHLSGVYNAVAPAPVTNKELTMELAKQMNGQLFIPLHVPVMALKLMMGERSIEVLKSTTVSAAKIQQAGFSFLYPDITSALKQLCNK